MKAAETMKLLYRNDVMIGRFSAKETNVILETFCFTPNLTAARWQATRQPGPQFKSLTCKTNDSAV
jgi:hypothetical protein